MANLKVVARIAAKADHLALVKEELIKLIDTTRAEEGCLQYELFQKKDETNVFYFCETWESKELLDKHLANDHIAAYVKATEGMIDDFVVNELDLVK